MKKGLFILLIFCFSLTVISCSEKIRKSPLLIQQHPLLQKSLQ